MLARSGLSPYLVRGFPLWSLQRLLCALSIFGLAGAMTPASRGAAQAMRGAAQEDGIALPANISELKGKIPTSLLGFLRKEEQRHLQQRTASKEDRAQQQATDTLEMLRLFRPCARCGTPRRYGSIYGGGYVMCDELMQGAKAAYSFGIGGNDDWGIEVSKTLGVPVFEFDCYHTERPRCPAGSHCDLRFAEECLGLPQNENESLVFRSLEEHLRRHTPLKGQPVPRGGDLILKVDVEGKEWNVFMDARLQDLRRMRQIVVEFHALSRVEFHEYFVKTLQRIMKAGFEVAHVHGNNFGPMALFGDGRFQLADDLEVTFVNKLALLPGTARVCRTTQPRLLQDAKDNPYTFDLPLPRLPGENETIRPSRIRVVKCFWWCRVLAVVMGIGPFVVFTLSLVVLMLLLIFVLRGPRDYSVGKKPKSSKHEGVAYLRRSRSAEANDSSMLKQ